MPNDRWRGHPAERPRQWDGAKECNLPDAVVAWRLGWARLFVDCADAAEQRGILSQAAAAGWVALQCVGNDAGAREAVLNTLVRWAGVAGIDEAGAHALFQDIFAATGAKT